MVQAGAALGSALIAARLAALLSEPRLGGDSVDLGERLEAMGRDRRPAARDAERLAERWARIAGGGSAQTPHGDDLLGRLLLAAHPERLAQRAGAPGVFRLWSGRGVAMDPAEPLAAEPWLAVADTGGALLGRDRIRLAAPVDEKTVLSVFADKVESETVVRIEVGRVRIKQVCKLGALVLDARDIAAPDPALIADALIGEVRRQGLAALPVGEPGPASLRARIAFLRALDGEGWPDLSDAALLQTLETWLAPALHGRSSLADISADDLEQALAALLPWEDRRRWTGWRLRGSPPRPGPASPSTTPRRAGRRWRRGCRNCSASPPTRRWRKAARRWCWRSPPPPAARSRSPATCRGSGAAHGRR